MSVTELPVSPYLFSQPGAQAAPFTFTVPATLEVQIDSATATYDGTSASGDFLPVMSFYSPSGVLIARMPLQSAALTAGSSEEVSWFPFAPVVKGGSTGGSLTITDGTNTVSDVTEIDFTGASNVVDLGGGVASVEVLGTFAWGFGGSSNLNNNVTVPFTTFASQFVATTGSNQFEIQKAGIYFAIAHASITKGGSVAANNHFGLSLLGTSNNMVYVEAWAPSSAIGVGVGWQFHPSPVAFGACAAGDTIEVKTISDTGSILVEGMVFGLFRIS